MIKRHTRYKGERTGHVKRQGRDKRNRTKDQGQGVREEGVGRKRKGLQAYNKEGIKSESKVKSKI